MLKGVELVCISNSRFPGRKGQKLQHYLLSIVYELNLDRKNYFFVVLYRSSSQDQQEFEDFMNNFVLMISKMSAEEPYAIIVTGRPSHWWDGDNENDEGKQLGPLMSDLGLHRLISVPTHMIGQSKSCIDQIITDQPKLSVRNLAQPPFLANYGFTIGLIFSLYGKVSKCITGERLSGR